MLKHGVKFKINITSHVGVGKYILNDFVLTVYILHRKATSMLEHSPSKPIKLVKGGRVRYFLYAGRIIKYKLISLIIASIKMRCDQFSNTKNRSGYLWRGWPQH